jgi:hypothetical protein
VGTVNVSKAKPRLRTRAKGAWLAIALSVAASSALAGNPVHIVAYEWDEDFFPELFWDADPFPPPGERRIENGWYIHSLSSTDEDSFFRTAIDRFFGVDGFFVEWRAISDSPAWLVEEVQVPAIMSASGQAASWYRMTFADSAAGLFRHPFLPFVVAEISAGIPHVYRLEVYPDQYFWYIDGLVADSGVPQGPYPDANAVLGWGTRSNGFETTSAWDYIRFGRISDDGTGDIDTDNEADHVDTPYVIECLTRDGPEIFGGPQQNAGPGCRFTDFDGDSDVDLLDFAEFANIFEED